MAAIAASLAPLSAHDFWLEPTTFAPQAGQIVGVRLRVGQDFLGDPVPRDPSLVNQFVFEDANGRKPLVDGGRESKELISSPVENHYRGHTATWMRRSKLQEAMAFVATPPK